MQKKTTLMHPNQLRVILIFLITPTTTSQFAGYGLQHGNTENHKNLKQKFVFQLGTLYLQGINEHLSFHYSDPPVDHFTPT